MQIAKEKNLRSFPAKDSGETNQGSSIDYGLDASDMIGLSWLIIEEQDKYGL